jgi:hypothetical protein
MMKTGQTEPKGLQEGTLHVGNQPLLCQRKELQQVFNISSIEHEKRRVNKLQPNNWEREILHDLNKK